MAVEIHYTYDEELARRAVRRYVARAYRWSFMSITFAVLAAALFAAQRTWWLVSAFALYAIIYAVNLGKYRRAAIRRARWLGMPEVTVSVDDGGMTFTMPSYRTEAGWSPQRQVWQFDDVWIFFPFGTSSAYTAVPTAAMTGEFREIVMNNMRAQRAVVR